MSLLERIQELAQTVPRYQIADEIASNISDDISDVYKRLVLNACLANDQNRFKFYYDQLDHYEKESLFDGIKFDQLPAWIYANGSIVAPYYDLDTLMVKTILEQTDNFTIIECKRSGLWYKRGVCYVGKNGYSYDDISEQTGDIRQFKITCPAGIVRGGDMIIRVT